MRYSILGPIGVQDGAREVPLGQGRQRLLLAVLLLHPSQALSSDRLIDALWGESPPPTAGRSLHNLVSALRKALGNGALVTRGHAYALEVGPDELDAQRFAALADRGRAALDDGDADTAARLLREALELWHGDALADVAYEPAVQEHAAHLDERRLEAIEDRIDADLARGRHADLLVELAARAAEHPTRERIRGQQMLALYRAGRQAEALEVYGDTRRHLVDELGIEPGPALRRLEQAILEQDPALGSPDALPAAPAARRRLPRPAVLISAGAVVLVAAVAAVLASGSSSPRSEGLEQYAERVTAPSGVRERARGAFSAQRKEPRRIAGQDLSDLRAARRQLPHKPRQLLLHDAGERRGAERQDLVVEVVARIVHRQLPTRVAVADVDVGARARFQHEGEILRRHDQVALALDVLLADELGRDVGEHRRLRRRR